MSDSFTQKNDTIDLKKIFLIVIAVISTLALLYVIYAIINQRQIGVIDNISIPSIEVQNNVIPKSFTEVSNGKNLDELNQGIEENATIQELKLFGDYEEEPSIVGNPNPFRPFNEVVIPTPQTTNSDVLERRRRNGETLIPQVR